MRSETRCVTEWAVHMYEEGDSPLKRYAACCSRLYPCEKNPNMRGGTLWQDGKERRHK